MPPQRATTLSTAASGAPSAVKSPTMLFGFGAGFAAPAVAVSAGPCGIDVDDADGTAAPGQLRSPSRGPGRRRRR